MSHFGDASQYQNYNGMCRKCLDVFSRGCKTEIFTDGAALFDFRPVCLLLVMWSLYL